MKESVLEMVCGEKNINPNYSIRMENTGINIRPLERIKKKCLCCGDEIELLPYEDRDFCDRCFPIVCREVFNKANDGMTVEEVKERIRINVEGN